MNQREPGVVARAPREPEGRDCLSYDETRDLIRSTAPPRPKTLLVLALGFGDPTTGAIDDAAVAALMRKLPADSARFKAVLWAEGETPDEPIDLDRLLDEYRPHAVLFLLGPGCWAVNAYEAKTADDESVSALMGRCVSDWLPVYRHASTTRGLPVPSDRVVYRGQPMRKTEPLVCDTKAARIGTLPAVEYRQHRWSEDDLRETKARFGECVYWHPWQAVEHGLVDHVLVGASTSLGEPHPMRRLHHETLGPVLFDPARQSRQGTPEPEDSHDLPSPRHPSVTVWLVNHDRENTFTASTFRERVTTDWHLSEREWAWAECRYVWWQHASPLLRMEYPISVELAPGGSDTDGGVTAELAFSDYKPLSFRHVRTDYWLHLLGKGGLYGEYRQRVRQYVDRVAGRRVDTKLDDALVGLHAADWVLSETFAERCHREAVDEAHRVVGGKGVPDGGENLDRTPTGHWDRKGTFRPTGSMEPYPRHQVDLSAYLERRGGRDAERWQAAQVGQTTLRHGVKGLGQDAVEEYLAVGVGDEDEDFSPSIVAWQDEYDRLTAARDEPSLEDRVRRLKGSREAACWELLLDRQEAIDAVTAMAETVTDPEADAGYARTPADVLDTLESRLDALRKVPAEASTLARAKGLSLWQSIVESGTRAREAIARKRVELADPEGFRRAELEAEALAAEPGLIPLAKKAKGKRPTADPKRVLRRKSVRTLMAMAKAWRHGERLLAEDRRRREYRLRERGRRDKINRMKRKVKYVATATA